VLGLAFRDADVAPVAELMLERAGRLGMRAEPRGDPVLGIALALDILAARSSKLDQLFELHTAADIVLDQRKKAFVFPVPDHQPVFRIEQREAFLQRFYRVGELLLHGAELLLADFGVGYVGAGSERPAIRQSALRDAQPAPVAQLMLVDRCIGAKMAET